MGLAPAFPSVPGTIAGTGLAVLAWLMRVGFVGAPPLVGMIADATSLRFGLLLVPAAGLAIVAAAGVLSGRRQPVRS